MPRKKRCETPLHDDYDVDFEDELSSNGKYN